MADGTPTHMCMPETEIGDGTFLRRMCGDVRHTLIGTKRRASRPRSNTVINSKPKA